MRLPEPLPIKIAYLITDLNVGGAQMALVNILRRLDRKRFIPKAVCLSGGHGIPAQQIRAMGIQVIDLRFSQWGWLGGSWRLCRWLRKEKPTILHASLFHANILARILGRIAGTPIILTWRQNVSIGGPWREFANRLTAGLDDCVTAASEAVRQAEIHSTKVVPGKVIVVPNCIDLGEYPPERSPLQEAEKTSLDVPPDAFRIGFVGRLHPQKGLDFLLQAMQMIRDRLHNAMLFIIGDGELRRSLENQTREYGLQHIVSFLGTSQDIPSLLYSLNLFVLPSLWEGMPVALLEAMAAGLPVVATSVGGVPEVVLDGETGFLVPPGNPEALGQAILALYEQPELRIHMGLAGKQRVQNCFSSETVTRNLELIYQELLEEKQWLPRRA